MLSSSSTTKSTKSYRLLSMDIGRKNLAVCVYDARRRRCTFWKNYDTDLKTYESNQWRTQLCKILVQLPPADYYLVERQVPVPENHKNLLMEAIITCIITFLHGKTPIIVRPKEVSAYFGMTKKKYYKKRDATVICEQILCDRSVDIRMRDPQMATLFLQKRGGIQKRDDLADCFLQAIWYGETKLFRRAVFNPDRYKNYLEQKEQDVQSRKRKHTADKIVKGDDDDDDDDEKFSFEEEEDDASVVEIKKRKR